MGVLDKAVSILDALGGGPLTLGELTAATGLHRATAHRLVTALALHGLASRAPDAHFALGPRMVGPGAPAVGERYLGLVEAAGPALAALRDATGESVQLYVPAGDRRVCLVSLESPHGLRTIVPLGASLPMDRGSAGAVMRRDPVVEERGWAQSAEEREPGVASVSAPVRAEGRIVAAVSVSGPVQRTTRLPGRRYATAVVAAAEAVEAALRGRARRVAANGGEEELPLSEAR